MCSGGCFLWLGVLWECRTNIKAVQTGFIVFICGTTCVSTRRNELIVVVVMMRSTVWNEKSTARACEAGPAGREPPPPPRKHVHKVHLNLFQRPANPRRGLVFLICWKSPRSSCHWAFRVPPPPPSLHPTPPPLCLPPPCLFPLSSSRSLSPFSVKYL